MAGASHVRGFWLAVSQDSVACIWYGLCGTPLVQLDVRDTLLG
jgi:hypothetical protein